MHRILVKLGTDLNHQGPRNIVHFSMAFVMEEIYIFVYFNILYFVYIIYINILFKGVYIITSVMENLKSSNIQDILAVLNFMWRIGIAI